MKAITDKTDTMAIIKTRTEARITDTDTAESVIASEWMWEEITHPTARGRQLTKEEALAIIREEGMILVHSVPGVGQIYDYPNEPFLEKYAGFYKKRRS